MLRAVGDCTTGLMLRGFMPYIRYQGVWSPGSIRDQVSYADPHAPCYGGHERLVADARRLAEEAHTDAGSRAQAVAQYIADHPYPGLEHVGGVGFVDAIPDSANCELVSAAEYQRLRSEIEKANNEYQVKRAETLSKKNDPSRRAAPEHEKLGWRTRVWIVSYAELEHHIAYPVGKEAAAYMRVRQDNPTGSGSTVQLIDIYHSSKGDVQQALLEGVDLADRVADLLALTGYGASHVVGVLGTTVPSCKVAQEFHISIFGARIRNTAVSVGPSQFPAAELDPEERLALRHVRDGLSAHLPTVAFAAFWNALEREAEDEARVKNLKRMARCKNCGELRTVGLDTKSVFETFYKEAGVDPSLFDRHRSKRGTIQHGGKLPTSGYLEEVFQDLPQVQVAAVAASAKKAGVAPRTTSYLSTCWPVIVLSCRARSDGTITVQNTSFGVRAALNTLPQGICGDAAREGFFGMDSSPNVDPLSFPPIER